MYLVIRAAYYRNYRYFYSALGLDLPQKKFSISAQVGDSLRNTQRPSAKNSASLSFDDDTPRAQKASKISVTLSFNIAIPGSLSISLSFNASIQPLADQNLKRSSSICTHTALSIVFCRYFGLAKTRLIKSIRWHKAKNMHSESSVISSIPGICLLRSYQKPVSSISQTG